MISSVLEQQTAGETSRSVLICCWMFWCFSISIKHFKLVVFSSCYLVALNFFSPFSVVGLTPLERLFIAHRRRQSDEGFTRVCLFVF